MQLKTQKARGLRKKSTWAEKALWRSLRNRRFLGCKFRRQHPFGPYFLDFYCSELSVAIELDGSEHGFPERKERDHRRDEYLTRNGIRMIRVWNCHLRENTEGVMERIRREIEKIKEKNPHPNPLPLGEGAVPRPSPTPRSRGRRLSGVIS